MNTRVFALPVLYLRDTMTTVVRTLRPALVVRATNNVLYFRFHLCELSYCCFTGVVTLVLAPHFTLVNPLALF